MRDAPRMPSTCRGCCCVQKDRAWKKCCVIVTVGSDGTFPLDRPLSLHVRFLMPSATPAHLSDEDFINKSLLDSLNAQADAEPVHPDDDIHDPDPRYAQPRHHPHPAPDDQQDQYASFHALHNPDGLFPVHQGLYSTQPQHIRQEYPQEYIPHPHHPSGAQQAQVPAAKLNGAPPGSTYRNSFTSYPNTTRTRLQASQGGLAANPSYRESGSTFYPSQDGFNGQVTSPIQPYGSYDYPPQAQVQLHQPPPHHHQQQQLSSVANGVHKSPYLIDSYSASSKASAQQPQSVPGLGQPYAFPSSIGVQLSSQTPYGPHIPAGGSIGVPTSNSHNGANPGIPSGSSTAMPIATSNSNGPTTTANGEEISTIFVVGFPEDMQEREFQNMFTFSTGFEAATLKIPNKDYNAYNPLLGGSGTSNGVNGVTGSRPYGATNDPYNVVNVNQGGIVDGGRDGIGSWAAAQPDELASHYAMGGMGMNPLNALNTLNPLNSLASLNPLGSQAALPPRKQIIGFAKFRSREEALAARDALQGRRVDIEKGAVLKAEMAKKNLHTKRGVGLVGGVGQVGNIGQQPQVHTLDNMGYAAAEPALARIGHWSRENGQASGVAASMPTLQAMEGPIINGFSKENTVGGPVTEDEGRKRDSVSHVAGILPNLSLGPAIRGAREREEEDRRRRGEREMTLSRLRATNTAAFDAFHAVANPSATSNIPVVGNGVTPGNGNGSNNGVKMTVISRQSSTASSNSLWGSSAVTSGAVAAINASSQQLLGQDNSGLGSVRQTDLLESPSEEEDAQQTAHRQQLQQQLDDEDEFERQQMEQERRQEEDAMRREYQERLQQGQVQIASEDPAVGPWDQLQHSSSYAAIARHAGAAGGGSNGATIDTSGSGQSQVHPSSSSERSTSPSSCVDVHHGPAPSQGQGGYIPQFQHLQYHHEQQRLLQRQSQLFGQQAVQQSQSNHGYRTQSESSETSAIDVNPIVNPAGYVGAAPMRPLGAHTNGILERLQQHASSSSSSTSASVSTSTSTSALASGSTSALASSVSSTSSTSGGVVNGSAGGSSGGVSPLPQSTSSGSGSASTSAPGSTGNTSPQLPSPAGSGGSSSTTSLRGTVDQNPPINTLYVGNLPTSPPPSGYPNDYLEDTLREVFSVRPGYRKLCFRQKANGPMCFVEFEDVHYASKALNEMSGNTLRGAVKNGIRLSYSKNPLGVRPPNSSGQTTSGTSTPSQVQQFPQNNNTQYQHAQQLQSLSSVSDEFSGHQQPRLPTAILRRDSTLSPTSSTYMGTSSSNGSQNSFFSSPPPRFYSAGSPTGSIQLTGSSTAFVPRTAAAAANGSALYGYNGPGGAFSPFGMSFGGNDAQSSVIPPNMQPNQMYTQHEGAQQHHADEL